MKDHSNSLCGYGSLCLPFFLEDPNGHHFPGCSPWVFVYFSFLYVLLFCYVFGFIFMYSCMHVVIARKHAQEW